MRAALYDQFQGDIGIVELPDPEPPPDGVVIEVGANGVCRSDWHAWMGHDDEIVLPHVPGHEMAGTIVAKGSEVAALHIGDRVTTPFVLGCGACPECRSGNQQICDNQYQPGFTGWGAFAELVALPYADGNVVKLPDGMPFETAAGLGCRFSTAFRAVAGAGRVETGTRIAIWGCGGVGLSAVMVAAAFGAEVLAVDVTEAALRRARELGASHTVLSGPGDDVAVAVRDAFSGGADVSIDALGSETTAVASIECLAKRGRHVQVGLMIGDAAHAHIPMWRLHGLEIEMVGVHGMPAHQYPPMLKMIAEGRLSPADLISATVDLRLGIDHLTAMGSFRGEGLVIINEFGTPDATESADSQT